jgi:cyclophilin family peptidyl-prolyl cis-trans isomerase
LTELAQADFYDGLTFHRVIDGFVIKGGDPTGTGSGGSALGNFDDQFHVDLQHNRAGVLSYVKSSDDTNDSQFFVTLGPSRHLDFDYSIFGLLVEGYSVLDGIAQVQTDANDRPLTSVVMDDVSIFNDSENAVLMLKAPEGYTGQTDITVTVTDPSGHRSQQTFHVNVLPDTAANGGANGGPFLEDIAPIDAVINVPAQIELSATDVEGDAVYYDAASVGAVMATVNVDQETGLVTVTPPEDYIGQLQIMAGVRALYGSDTADSWDTQLVTIEVAVSWQNPIHPCDVDANDYVTPEDLLILISYLNAHVGDASLPPSSATPPPFLDVNDDGWCTASDLLEVVTYINRLVASGGEGESSVLSPRSTFPYDSLANTDSSAPTVPTDHNVPSTDRFAQCAVDIAPTARRSDWPDEMLDFRGGSDDGLLDLRYDVVELEDTLACILDDVAREWQSL